jgi:hypothetical protein
MQIEDNLKAGMNPAEARYAALRSFGCIEPMKERLQESQGPPQAFERVPAILLHSNPFKEGSQDTQGWT